MSEEAQNEFLEVLKVNPQHAQAFEGLGWVFFKTGDLERANKNLQQAIAFEDTLWQAHHLLGIIYDRQQNYEKAIQQYKKAISIKPNMPMLFNNLGVCLLLKGDYNEALGCFVEALKLEASNNRVQNNLGLTLCKLGRYDEALEVFKKNGDEAAAYNNLGYIFMIEGKNKDAIKAFEKALEIKPGFYTKAYENLKKAKAHAQPQDDGDRRPLVRHHHGGACRLEIDLDRAQLSVASPGAPVNEDKASRFHRRRRWAQVGAAAAGALLLVAWLASGASVSARDLARSLARGLGAQEPAAAAIEVAACAAALALVLGLVDFPFELCRSFLLERRYGLTSETPRSWLADHAKGLLVGAAVGLIAAEVAYAALRWSPGWWWLVDEALRAQARRGVRSGACGFDPRFARCDVVQVHGRTR